MTLFCRLNMEETLRRSTRKKKECILEEDEPLSIKRQKLKALQEDEKKQKEKEKEKEKEKLKKEEEKRKLLEEQRIREAQETKDQLRKHAQAKELEAVQSNLRKHLDEKNAPSKYSSQPSTTSVEVREGIAKKKNPFFKNVLEQGPNSTEDKNVVHDPPSYSEVTPIAESTPCTATQDTNIQDKVVSSSSEVFKAASKLKIKRCQNLLPTSETSNITLKAAEFLGNHLFQDPSCVSGLESMLTDIASLQQKVKVLSPQPVERKESVASVAKLQSYINETLRKLGKDTSINNSDVTRTLSKIKSASPDQFQALFDYFGKIGYT